jgi:periplasmic copper chaperone A
MGTRTLILVLAAMLAVGSSAAAESTQAGSLMIEQPWARPTIGEATNSAAYMTVSNGGDKPDRLTGVKTAIAADAMLHESRMEGDVMKMVHLHDGLEVAAHGTAELKPLGAHVMLMGLKRPLKEGETFPLTLTFANQGDVTVTVTVAKQQPAAAEPMHEHK